MHIGHIQSIHRFPVKSMAGEALTQAHVGPDGLFGDRGFALRDEQAGEIRGGKRMPKLMQCSAQYREEPGESGVTHASITMPNGALTSTDDPNVSRVLSEWLGREVTLCPRAPASDKEHYRRKTPGAAMAGALGKTATLRKVVVGLAKLGPGGKELREDFGREPNEPLPDLSVFPAELLSFVSPLGTYFDAYPIHVLTTATLAALRDKQPQADWSPLRFRPNLLVETELTGLVEAGWEQRRLRVGELVLECTVGTPRCSMVTQSTPTLPKDTSVLRTIVREAKQCVGIYARVVQGGVVRQGDAVELT